MRRIPILHKAHSTEKSMIQKSKFQFRCANYERAENKMSPVVILDIVSQELVLTYLAVRCGKAEEQFLSLINFGRAIISYLFSLTNIK